MAAAGAASIGEFILRAHNADSSTEAAPSLDDQRHAALGGEPRPVAPESAEASIAKLRNTEIYVERVTTDPRYHAEQHRRVPRKIGRRLVLLDCLTCDKCIPACPNDAVFTYVLEGAAEPHQIASFADFCNDCGNCDVFCPEDGGPQVLKPRIFVNRERYLADAPRDAILIEPGGIAGRFGGVEYRGDEDSIWSPFLNRLRAAVLAPSEVNYVRSSL
jgi:putative selenate reductase